MKAPKGNQFCRPCHECEKKTVYALRVKPDSFKDDNLDVYFCPDCIAGKVRQHFYDLLKGKQDLHVQTFRNVFYPGFRFSVYTVGRTLDINIMIPSNAVFCVEKGGWPFVYVASDPITYEMESVLRYSSTIEGLTTDISEILVKKFLLEPEAETNG